MKHLHWTRYLSRQCYVRFVNLIWFFCFYFSFSRFFFSLSFITIWFNRTTTKLIFDILSLFSLIFNEMKRKKMNFTFFFFECLKLTMEARKYRLSTFFLCRIFSLLLLLFRFRNSTTQADKQWKERRVRMSDKEKR